jgi:hypothetical protein
LVAPDTSSGKRRIQQAAEREVAIGSLERNFSRLREVKAALSRLDSRTFGIGGHSEEEIGQRGGSLLRRRSHFVSFVKKPWIASEHRHCERWTIRCWQPRVGVALVAAWKVARLARMLVFKWTESPRWRRP